MNFGCLNILVVQNFSVKKRLTILRPPGDDDEEKGETEQKKNRKGGNRMKIQEKVWKELKKTKGGSQSCREFRPVAENWKNLISCVLIAIS